MPHIHKEQVLHDIQNWNKEKEAEYKHRIEEKARLAKLAEERAAEKARLEEEERLLEQARKEEEKRLRKAELGSDAEEDEDEDKDDEKAAEENPDESKPEGAVEGEGAEGEEGAPVDDRQANYDRQLKQLAADEASSDDEFVPLGLK